MSVDYMPKEVYIMQIYQADPRIMWSKDLFLRKPCRPLSREEVLTDEFSEIVKLLFESLYQKPGGVGLAAPQIGLQVMLVVIDMKRDGKKPLVLINPEYSPNGDEKAISTETCMSFQNYTGTVSRYSSITVKAKDLNFNDIVFQASGFKSYVCQHEIDHLLGKVYIDKVDQLELSKAYCVSIAEKAFSNTLSNL